MSQKPKYLQIADTIIREIVARRLVSGQKLPGTRNLADLLHTNRKTIIHAYDELTAQGWLENVPSSGTYVNSKLPLIRFKKLQPANGIAASAALPGFNTYEHIPDSDAEDKVIVRIDGGSPDVRMAPLDWFFKECRSIARTNYGKRLMAYGSTHGDEVLINVMVDYLSVSRAMRLTADHIMITRGSQMGIYLAMHCVIDRGDTVVIGDSSYNTADWTALEMGARLVRISVDRYGLDIDQLEKLCRKQVPKLVYVTPHHHFPTTVTLSNERRIQLLNLANKYNFFILEDDYDYDFHFTSGSILPLASLDKQRRVIYIGSFSKIYAPNIRVGYMVASAQIICAIGKYRRLVDRQGDHVVQRVIAESITSGELARHLRKSLKTYRSRRDVMASMLTNTFSDEIEFSLPEGGMAIWAIFKNSQLNSLHPVLKKLGLLLDIDPQLSEKFNGVRLGFASVNHGEIKQAMRLLEKGIKWSAS